MSTLKITNPATEAQHDFTPTTVEELRCAFEQLTETAKSWRQRSVQQRVALLEKVLEQLAESQSKVARTITEDMGKPFRWACVEIERAIREARELLKQAPKWLEPRLLANSEGAPPHRVQFDPLGTVAVIAPWNFPILLPLRGIIPALVAGNGVIFKPSELSLRSGETLVELFEEVIQPCPLFGAYGGGELGEAVTKLPVALIAFTGSTTTGKKIAQVAAEGLKRSLLELGGLDAAIVLRDADIGESAKEIVLRNALNSGQVCAAVKRVYVERPIYSEFVAALLKEQEKLVIGDPLDPATEIGPLASRSQLERVQSFAEDAVKKGARVLRGGKRIDQRGFFFEPTIMVDIPDNAKLLSEEPFGPILPVMPIESGEEGIKKANSVRYGLMASLFTRDTERAEQLASELEVGTVCINCHFPGGPGTPFGGVKESGYGRVRTEEGLHEYTNIKLIRHAPR